MRYEPRRLLDRVTDLLLEHLAAAGFALAGAGAIREHGLTDRPTHDIDLFAQSPLTVGQFAGAVTRAQQTLTGKEHDDGFDSHMLAQQLARVADMPASYAAQYGIDEDTIHSDRR